MLDAETGNDVKPGDDGPQAVLLADMVAPGAEALLSADRQLVRVKQGAEELPARGHLVAVEALLLGHEVDGARCGHAAGQAVHPVLPEVGDELGVVGDDGERVARRDEGARAVDHVAVAIAVRGRAERDVLLVHHLDKGVGIGEVGVWVAAVEVWRRLAVLGGIFAEAKFLPEDGGAIGASDTRQAVEEDLEVGILGEELLDQVEVEDVLQHGDVVGRAVDNLHLEAAICLGADSRDVDVRDIGKLVGCKGLGRVVDLVGDGLRSRSTVGKVVFDAEVVLGACRRASLVFERIQERSWGVIIAILTAGVVAGGQEDASCGLALPDNMAGSRSRENAVLADQEFLDAISSTDLCNQLDHLGVPEATVTTNDKESAYMSR